MCDILVCFVNIMIHEAISVIASQQ